MISTATKIKFKRSGIEGRIPTLADLQLGELGINYNDGKIFIRQENETVGARIIEPGTSYEVGKTIFVTVEGNDNNAGLNERDAKRSIKAAAAIAEPGDSIKVYPGQYIEDNPIIFKDRVSVEGMELRNVLVTPANPGEDLYLVGDGFHATNHSFVSNQDSTDGAAIISFRRLEGTASDRYFDAARLIRDNLNFIAGETVGFLTSGYSGFAAGQRSQDAARAIELNKSFISEEAFQYINSPDYRGPAYVNPDPNQCRSDLRDILDGWRYDLISDGNSESTGVGLTYYAPIRFINEAKITDLVYNNKTGDVIIETDISTQSRIGDVIKLADIRLDCDSYNNEYFISAFSYNNESGLAVIGLPFLHDIKQGDLIKLDGLEFDCPPYGAEQYSIRNFKYNEVTGGSLITLNQNHNLKVGDSVELRDLQFDCPAYGGRFTNIVDLDYDNVAGTGVITFEDSADLKDGDIVLLYDLKMACPSYGNAISVTDFQYDNFTGQSEVTVASPHNLRVGDLVKLENLKFTCDSYLNETFGVVGFTYDNTTGEAVATFDKNHSFVSGEQVELKDLVFQCNSYLPSEKGIVDFTYDNVSGISTILLDTTHGRQVGDLVRLEDISFACNSYSFTQLDVIDAPYDNETGFVTVQFATPHGSKVGERVRLSNLEYTCSNSGITTTLFPDGTFGYEFEVLSAPTPRKVILNVGTSTIVHTYAGGGTGLVGITTTTFPDGTQGFDYTVTNVVDPNTLEVNVGPSTIAHKYNGGGRLFTGITTTFFPDGTQGFDFTITSIPSGNQIGLNVGISTIAHSYVSGGTAQTKDSFLGVNGFAYDNVAGTGLVTLDREHGLVVGDSFLLEDLQFECDSYRDTARQINVTNANYDKNTGLVTIDLATTHNLSNGDRVALYDLEFSCPGGSGITTTLFPSGERPNFYTVLGTPSPLRIVAQVGVSSITHNYIGGGTVQVGITTNIFPDGTRPGDPFFSVISVPSPTQVLTNVGVSSIAHTYAAGGKFYTGITTNIFPQTFEDPNINVQNAVYDESTGDLTVTTEKPHGLSNGSEVLLLDLTFSCLSGGQGNTAGELTFPRNQEVYTVANVIDPFNYVTNVGTNNIAHTYVNGGTSTTQNILDAVYNNVTGELTVTLDRQHGYATGDKAAVTDLLFSCLSGGANNAPGQLLFPRPTDEFEVLSVNGNEIVVNVGPSPDLPHSYISGGSIKFGGTTVAITNAIYNEFTGDLTATTASPVGASAGDTVVVQGLEFSCQSGGPNNDPGSIIFPRLDLRYYPVTSVQSKVKYTILVGTSTLAHTYVSGGFSTLKKPENDPNIFRVIGVPAPDKIVTRVGVSSIAHDYVSGGNILVGITTNIFPDGTRQDGSRFEVLSALSPNQALIQIGVSSIPHLYESGGRLQYGETNERPVLAFDYDNNTGNAVVVVRGSHGLSVGDDVKLKGLTFTCANSPGITTTIFPDGTGDSLNIFKVNSVTSNNTFETNVGRVDFEHTYVRGGSVFVGITTNIFPDGTQGYEYTVNSVPSSDQITVNVGISSIQHDYVRGGTLFAGRSNERDILDFSYNEATGKAVLTLRDPEELYTNDLVKLQGLQFDCANSVGITTNIFPDGTRSNLFKITERLNSTQFQIHVGSSEFAHDYVRGTGKAFVGITTNIFPDGTRGKLFEVVSIPSPNSVTAKVGVSSIPHNYKRGGKISVGINTDIFPGGPDVSPRGDEFVVKNITNDGELVINVGPSSISHNYDSGGKVLFGTSPGGQLQHITGPGVKEATIAAIEFEKTASKYALNNRPFGSFIVAETSVIEEVLYNNVTGFATITAPGIKLQVGDLVRMSDIQFRCSDEYAGLTTTFFPDGTRPDGQYFEVETRIDDDTFEAFIGVSTIPHTYSRGGNAYRYRQNVVNVNYDNASGITSVRSLGHGLIADDIVELGDMRFNCPIFSSDYDIENFQYDNLTGLSTVTTTLDNTLSVGDLVKLDGIVFDCPPYGNEKDIVSFVYDNKTGFSTVTTSQEHNISLNSRPAISISTAAYDNVSGIITVTTTIPINLEKSEDGIILSGLGFSCAPIYAGLTTSIFPEDDTFVYKIEDVLSPSKFSIDVGISTIPHTYTGGGNATKVDLVDVKLQDIKFDCPAYGNDIGITNFLYDNNSGNSLITLDTPHNLKVGDTVKLADIKFQCAPYGNDFNVVDADYDNTTGILTMFTGRDLSGLRIGDTVRVKDLQFDCNSGVDYNIISIFFFVGNQSTARLVLPSRPANLNVGDDVKVTNTTYNAGTGPVSYPDGRDPSLNIFRVNDIQPNATNNPGGNPNLPWDILVSFSNIREATAVFIPTDPTTYGTLTVGVTTNIYPDVTQAEGGFYDVLAIPSDNSLTVQVGTSTIPHDYVRFGQVFSGVTTNFFPSPELQNSPKGNLFKVADIPRNDQIRVNVGVSTISHVYDSGGSVLVGITTNIFPDGVRNLFPVIGVEDSNTLRVNVGPSSIPHNYVDGGFLFSGITTNVFPGDRQNSPRGSIYKILSKDEECGKDRFTINVGPSSITHNYVEGGTVTTGVTTDRFPDGTFGFQFPVLSVIDNDNFLVNVGTSTITHNYIDGGFVKRIESPVRSFVYDNRSGLSTVTSTAHRLNIGDLVKVRDVKFDCDAYGGEKSVTGFVYDNTNGRAIVTTDIPHGLSINDDVKLSGIQMDCGAYGNDRQITNAVYNETTGVLLVQTAVPHGLAITDDVKLAGLEFDCVNSGITTNIFPDGTAPSYNIYQIIGVPNAFRFEVNVGISTIQHIYQGGGTAFVGVTTNIFPGSPQNSPRGSFLNVVDTPSTTQFVVNVGTSTITHSYVRGGLVQSGITTDIFPDGTQGDYFVVRDIIDEDTFEINTGISTIVHRYNSGGFISKYSTYQSKYSQVLDTSVIRVSGDCMAVADRVDQLAGIVTSILEKGPEYAPGGVSVDVESAIYNNEGGILSVTLKDAVVLRKGDLIDIRNLIFECESKGFMDIKVFPDNKVFKYKVQNVLSATTFTINVGASDIPHAYVSGGSVSIGLRFNVVNSVYNNLNGELLVETDEENYFVENTGVNLNGMLFNCPSGGNNGNAGTLSFPDGRPANVTGSTYDNLTGLLTVTTDKPHQLYRDAKVRLEGLEFSCPGGSLIYPSNPDLLIRVSKVVDPYTYQCQLETSTKVHTYVQGGTSDPGAGNYRIDKVIDSKTFIVQMAPINIPHTWVGGGTAASVFAQQVEIGINLRTKQCADDVKRIYLSVAHDITRGGNWKCVEAGKRYYDALGQIRFIAGGEIDQTVQALDYSLNVVRNVINNVSWGGVPRGYYTNVERRNLSLPKSTKTSVVSFKRPEERGQFTTEEKTITGFQYDRVTGIATVTTSLSHELTKYDAIKLSDIQMRCQNSPRKTTNIFPDGTQGEIFEVVSVIDDNPIYPIATADYDHTTGRLLVGSVSQPGGVDLPVGSKINLRFLRFECSSAGFPGTLVYPTDNDFAYEILERPTDDSLVVNIGISTIAHTFIPVTTGIDFPQIQELPTTFTTHVGTVGFNHIYEKGGKVWRRDPFQRPQDATQVRDVSIQDDPIQNTNSTPNACANVFSAIENCVGIVTTIVAEGFENSGISTRYPGNDGQGVDSMDEMASQGVGNIIKGPYIRNCTNFVPKSIGMRMDGFDAEPGDEIPNGVQGSSNVDSFTQFNPGGIGCSISNGTYQQLVSIFTICCDEAIVCDSGAQLDLTNSNSSFGRLGLVARGIGDNKSKCIDRYTGIVAEEALIEDDTVVISGVGNKRPYDGQGIFFGELYREVVRIEVTDGGSGYDDNNPPKAFVAEPTGPSGIKAEVSPTVTDGVVTSIELISNGNQYRERNPIVTIDPPKAEDGRQAAAIAITEPLYYDVDSSSEPKEGTVKVVFKQRLNNTVSVGTTVFFSRLSLQIASSHSFEYIGAGNSIDGARPSQGGVPIKANEVVKEDGGSIVYTSTDQAGNFNIGDDFVINQFTGTVTGRSFDQSVLNKVTPLIIALDS